MNYIDRTLASGEMVTYRAVLHWIIYTPAITALVIGLLICTGGRDAAVFGSLLIALVALPFGIGAWVGAVTTEIAVTNRRLVVKRGLVSRKTVEILLTKIEAIGIEQGIWGRILDHGTVVVNGTGSIKTAYPTIADPLALRRAILEQIEQNG